MSKSKITYIGHATFLIEMDGQFILTDPNFSKKTLLSKRLQEPGMKPENLPDLTCIAISHANYSHLDFFSFKYFSLKTPIIVPHGLGKFLQKFLRNPIIELPPWGEHLFGDLKINSVPVKHTGFRWSGLRWRESSGYLFTKSDQTIYFPGDTAYSDHFREVSNLHNIDIALLPIGNSEPRWWMKNRKMNPKESLRAFKDLKAKLMIPYHWGTFHSPFLQPDKSLEIFKEEIKNQKIENVKILEVGGSYSVSH